MKHDYYSALHACAERYRDMQLEAKTPRDDKLWLFTMEFMFGCRDRLPLMKLNRWLGYIQASLIQRGYTTVEAERDWTRPLFRPLDFPGETA
jgi:hypothetical protein